VLKRFNKGSTTQTTIFSTDPVDSQTLYPRLSGGGAAQGSFTIPGTQAFGFRIDNEWSDDTKNPQEHTGGGWGHHVRFFPLRDTSGNLVPDTYIMVMDYNGVNYDYNDNMFLISNIRPETGGASTSSLASMVMPPSTTSTDAAAPADSLGAGDLLDSLSAV
jgi:hypothetical protein